MQSDPTPVPAPTPDPGLPTVEPPTGQMIVRLFLVPALIVGVLVALFLLGPTLSGWFNRLTGRSPGDGRAGQRYLTELDNPNPEIRYRAASDLAQVLLRNEELARDVDFGLGLTDRLKAALDASAEAEKKYATVEAGLTEGEKARELKKLEPDRTLITYLAASLGHLSVPVGVPLLGRMATQTAGMEPDALSARRGVALLALWTLGEKLKSSFDKLTDEQKDAVEEQLGQAAKTATAGSPARPALDFLRARRADKPTTMGVSEVLAATAADEDMFLRQLTAVASNPWAGSPAEEKVIEDFLVALSNDAGVGAEKLEERESRNPDSKRTQPITKNKGFGVQANATIALARRGSPRTPLDTLQVMLDEKQLGTIFVLRDSSPRGASGGAFGAGALAILLALCGLAAVVGSRWGQRPSRLLLGVGLVLIVGAAVPGWAWWGADRDHLSAAETPRRTEQANEALVTLTVTNALKALAELSRQRPEMKLDRFDSAVAALKSSKSAAVESEARKTLLALQSRK